MQEVMQFISNHQILIIIWISLLLSVLYTMFKRLISKVIEITSNEAIRLINKEDAVVIDLRQSSDFRKGHIIGAINLLKSDIKTSNLNKLNKYKNQPIIIIDNTGIKAQGAANKLNQAGFNKVFILKKGIAGWNENNLPLIRSK